MENQNQRLKILMLTEDFIPIQGGVTSVVEKSSLALSKYADVTIGTVCASKKLSKNFNEPITPYKVIRCKGSLNLITTNMQANLLDKDFKDAIEATKYDVIHCHLPFGGLYKYGLALGKKTDTPVIVTAHSILTPDIQNAVKLPSITELVTKIVVNRFNKADNIFCVSEFCKRHLMHYGLNPDVKVIYNCVEMDKDDKNVKVDFKKRYGIKKDTFVVSVIGRLVKIKNVPMLINAMAVLKEKNLNIKLLIIGHGPEKHTLQNLINKLKVNDYCIIDENVAGRDMLSAIYKRSNLIAFPSYGDSAGLIQVEASYFEKPTLALKNTAISEKMIDLQNGLIADNTPESLAEKILYAYNNRDKLPAMGKEAKRTLYRSYFDEKIIQELLQNYKKTIENYKSKSDSTKKPTKKIKQIKQKHSTKIKLARV